MAYQATSDAHVELVPRLLLRRPKLAQLLAVVASEWVSVEIGLTFLYATLLGKYLPHNQRQGPPIHPIGFQIFDALESLRKRLQLIERLAETLVTKKVLIKELEKKLIPLIRKAGDRRNDLVHGYWGINDSKYPNALMLIRAPGDFVIYEESDFNEAIALIESADDAVTEFENKVRKHLKWKKRPH